MECQPKRILIDHRAAVIKMSIGELYFLPQRLSDLGIHPAYKVALVFSEDSNHDVEVYQTRVNNVGLEHRVSTDIDAAFAWLGS